MGRGMRKRKPIFSAKELGLLSGEESDEESEDSGEESDDASDDECVTRVDYARDETRRDDVAA